MQWLRNKLRKWLGVDEDVAALVRRMAHKEIMLQQSQAALEKITQNQCNDMALRLKAFEQLVTVSTDYAPHPNDNTFMMICLKTENRDFIYYIKRSPKELRELYKSLSRNYPNARHIWDAPEGSVMFHDMMKRERVSL